MTILTVTINPSIDTLYKVKDFKIGTTNRTSEALKMVGGKGINSARVSTILGQETIAIGFVGGANGDYILNDLKKDNIENDFLKVDGESRNAITIMHNENIQTEINESGPDITSSDLDRLNDLIDKTITEKDVNIISLAGRIYGDDHHYYSNVLNRIKKYNEKIFVSVDTSGKALKSVLLNDTTPDLIKPNLSELSEFIGFEIKNDITEIKRVLSFTIFKSVYSIIVSLGSDGALAKIGDEFFKLEVPNVEIVNPTGSGDSTVAGFLTGLNKGLTSEDSLKYAMACGVANALEERVGFINTAVFEDLLKDIKVTKI